MLNDDGGRAHSRSRGHGGGDRAHSRSRGHDDDGDDVRSRSHACAAAPPARPLPPAAPPDYGSYFPEIQR